MCDLFRVAPAHWLVKDGIVNPSDRQCEGSSWNSRATASQWSCSPSLSWTISGIRNLAPKALQCLLCCYELGIVEGGSCPINRRGN